MYYVQNNIMFTIEIGKDRFKRTNLYVWVEMKSISELKVHNFIEMNRIILETFDVKDSSLRRFIMLFLNL